jgi:putative iron-only hydrogenase system regulator
MGVPYREQGIHVISIIVDAPQDTISALSGKLGMIPDISTKTIYPAVPK